METKLYPEWVRGRITHSQAFVCLELNVTSRAAMTHFTLTSYLVYDTIKGCWIQRIHFSIVVHPYGEDAT